MTRTLHSAFGATLALALLAAPAWSQEKMTTLFKIVTVKDLIAYRLRTECCVARLGETEMPLSAGAFRAVFLAAAFA